MYLGDEAYLKHIIHGPFFNHSTRAIRMLAVVWFMEPNYANVI
jgi:hypothetical protein